MTKVAIDACARKIKLATGMNVGASIAKRACWEFLARQSWMVEGAVGVRARWIEFAAFFALRLWLFRCDHSD